MDVVVWVLGAQGSELPLYPVSEKFNCWGLDAALASCQAGATELDPAASRS